MVLLLSDPTSLSVGARVGSLRVTETSLRPADTSPVPYDGQIAFSGELSLSGCYRPEPVTQENWRTLCFSPRETSSLPLLPAEPRPLFCFSNQTLAHILLAGDVDVGWASIVVDEFRYDSAKFPIPYSARLVRVVSHTPVPPTP